MAIYNRLTSETALIDRLKSLESRVQTVETQGTGTISFVDETDGVQTIIGTLPDGSTGLEQFVGDTTPPPVATVPTVSAQPGSFIVSWDGLFVAGADKPRDFVHVNVIGHKMNGTATVLSAPVGVIRLATESVIVGLDVAASGESWQFSLESQDYAGNKAVGSTRTPSYVMKDAISSVDAAWNTVKSDISAAQTSANNAQTSANNAQASADSAAADAATAAGIANSKGKVLTQTTAPGVDDQNSNTLWIDTTNGANTPKRWDGTAWVAVTDKAAIDAANAAATAQTRADQAYNEAVSAATAAGNAQTTADGKNRVWYQTTAPAGTAHKTGDTWFDTDDGNKIYLWTGSAWTVFQDAAIATAQNTANSAQTAANGKNTNYYQTNQPTGGTYKTGDTWFDTDDNYKMYSWSGTAWQLVQDSNTALTTANSKIKTFIQGTAPTATTTGDLWIDTANGNQIKRWSGSAWVDARDTTIATAQTTANDALTSANGKNRIFYQTAAPTGTFIVGDTWFDTDDGNKIYVWNGTAWTASQDAGIAAAQNTANSKTKTFIQATAPTATTVGDIWIDTANGNVIKTWEGSSWVNRADAAIATAQSTANSAQTAANGKNKIYYQTAMPTGGTYIVGDTWFDTDDGNKVYVYNGTTFAVAQDTSIATAQSTANTANSTANTALSTANSKIKTYLQPNQPGTTENTTGDIWFDTDDGNKVYVWNGSAWTVAQDTAIAAAQTSANGKNKNYYQTTQPSGGTYLTGDLWFDTDDNYKMYTYNGSAWVVTQDSAGAIVSAEKYSQSRGMDLVTNGNGQLLSNKNFSPFTYDQTDTPTGAVGVFDYPIGASLMLSDELMRVDPAKSYQLRVTAKQKTAGVITAAYTGLAPYDPLGLAISPTFYMEQANTRTTLAAALNPGATTITLTSAANWNNAGGASATHLRSMIVWNYVDGAGKLWAPGTYSRNYYGDLWNEGSISGNVITLKAPWAGPAIPAGTTVGNGSSGGTYMYVAMSNTIVPGTWTSYSGTVAGVHTDLTVSATTKFPIPTASVKLVFLGNRVSGSNPTTGSKHSFGNISFSEVSAANLEAGGITETLIGPNAVSTTKISDAAITNAKIADLAVTDAKISTLNAGKITAGVLDAARIGADTITSAHIAANAITADELAANSITAAKGQISDAAITTAKIADAQITNAKIADLAVTNAKIVDGTIQNAKIGNLDAAKITSGTIDANRIGANSITANKLLVGDFTNLASDGNFVDLSKASWTGSGTVVTETNAPNKLKIVTAASGNNDQPNVNSFQVTAGEQIYGEVWVYGEPTNVGGGGPNLHLAVALNNGTTTWPQFGSTTRTAVSGQWVKISGSVTIPANAKSAKVEPAVGYSADAVGNIYYFREVSVRRKATGSLIVDGAIQAGSAIIGNGAIGTAQIANLAVDTAQIKDGAVTNLKVSNLDAAKITTGTLDANRIGADTITSLHIASGTITATEMVAGTITAASGIIADAAITTAKIADLAVTDAKISTLNAGKITAGTLDAARIGANTITTSHLSSGNIDASVLTAGTITAPKIASKTITSDKLVITSTDNLVVEADFSNNGSSWGVLNSNKLISPTAGRGSLPALRVTGTTAMQTITNLVNKVTVGSEDRFRGSMYIKSSAAAASGTVKLRMNAYTTATSSTPVTIAQSPSLTAGTWTLMEGYSPALPVNTIAVEFFIEATNAATDTTLDIDYVAVTRAADGKLIVDGAIDGKTITGATIIGGEVRTTEQAGSIAARMGPTSVYDPFGGTVKAGIGFSVAGNTQDPAGMYSPTGTDLTLTQGGTPNSGSLAYMEIGNNKTKTYAWDTATIVGHNGISLEPQLGAVNVAGNLSVTGTLNGVNLSSTTSTAITYSNGWTDFGAGYGTLRVKEIMPGVVLLQGMPKPGTKSDGVVIGTIPTAFRPALIQNLATNVRTTLSPANDSALIQVNTNGNLHLFSNSIASVVYVTISVIYFLN